MPTLVRTPQTFRISGLILHLSQIRTEWNLQFTAQKLHQPFNYLCFSSSYSLANTATTVNRSEAGPLTNSSQTSSVNSGALRDDVALEMTSKSTVQSNDDDAVSGSTSNIHSSRYIHEFTSAICILSPFRNQARTSPIGMLSQYQPDRHRSRSLCYLPVTIF